MTVSLLLTLSAILVPLFGILLLAERPTWLQWSGIGIFLFGVGIYFYPIVIPAGEMIGVIAVLIGVLANSLSSILGRRINRDASLQPLTVTVVSMGVGAIVLLTAGLQFQGLPPLKPLSWLIILWLAIVNTALAFTLWNQSLQMLSATESSILNNAMLVQIAILAWVFLGETLTWQQALGMILASVGALIVQTRHAIVLVRSKRPESKTP